MNAVITRLASYSDASEIIDSSCLYVSASLSPDDVIPHITKEHVNLLFGFEGSYTGSLPENSNIVFLENESDYISFLETFTEISSQQNQLWSISNQMMQIVSTETDPYLLTKYAHSILQNPIIVSDISNNILFFIGVEELFSEENWLYAIKNKAFSVEYIDQVFHNIVSSNATNDMDRVIIDQPDSLSQVRQYSLCIHRNDNVVGHIMLLEACHPVSEKDIAVLKMLRDYLPFIRNSEFSASFLADTRIAAGDNLLQEILQDKITDKRDIYLRQEFYNLKMKKHLYLLTISWTNFKTSTISTRNMRLIQSLFYKKYIICKDGYVLVLYDTNTTKDFNDDSELMRQLQDLLNRIGAVANVSLPFKDLSDVINHHKCLQALQKYRVIVNNEAPILFYSDIVEYHSLLTLSNELELPTLIHPAVKYLMEKDRISNTDYLKTLFSYVKHNCSISETSKELFMHYNSVKNRIIQIEQDTSFSHENPRDCLNVRLSELILNIIDESDSKSKGQPNAPI